MKTLKLPTRPGWYWARFCPKGWKKDAGHWEVVEFIGCYDGQAISEKQAREAKLLCGLTDEGSGDGICHVPALNPHWKDYRFVGPIAPPS